MESIQTQSIQIGLIIAILLILIGPIIMMWLIPIGLITKMSFILLILIGQITLMRITRSIIWMIMEIIRMWSIQTLFIQIGPIIAILLILIGPMLLDPIKIQLTQTGITILTLPTQTILTRTGPIMLNKMEDPQGL